MLDHATMRQTGGNDQGISFLKGASKVAMTFQRKTAQEIFTKSTKL
jgi:hypothetical protein